MGREDAMDEGQQPRVTIVTHVLRRNDGQGRVNAEVVAHLSGAGYAFDIVAGDVSPDFRQLPGVRWHPTVAPRWLPTTLLRHQAFGLLSGRAARRLPRPDVLQLNGAISYGASATVNVANFVHADWARSPQHPWRSHPSPRSLYQLAYTYLNVLWERRAYRRSARVVAVSDQVRDALVRRVGVEPTRIVVIPPGVDDAQFRPRADGEPNALRAEIGAADADVLLLFVGDIQSNRKNLDLVLQAMVRLPANVRLAVIGGSARSPYPAMADRLGVAGRVHFLGSRSADLPALMRGADAFVFPSHYDPFALVVTEAMASGLPVVTVPTVGASSLIVDGQNGFVLPDASLDPLLAVLARLIDDPDLRRAVGRAARVTAGQDTWTAMAERYRELYESLAPRAEPAVPSR